MNKYNKHKHDLPKVIISQQCKDNDTDRAKYQTECRTESRKRHMEVIQEHVPDCKKILCLGCRTHHELQDFADAGYEVLGIDLIGVDSEHAIQLDAHLMGEKFGENEFDLVYASHSLEHMYDPNLALRGIRKVSRLGCMAILPTYGPTIRGKRRPSLTHPALYDLCLLNRKEFGEVTDLDLADFGEFHPYEFRHYYHYVKKNPEKVNQCEILFAW